MADLARNLSLVVERNIVDNRDHRCSVERPAED
jgi:hypothetical protein